MSIVVFDDRTPDAAQAGGLVDREHDLDVLHVARSALLRGLGRAHLSPRDVPGGHPNIGVVPIL